MAEASIPVDLLNPGQVFACIGLVEAAEILLGDAAGAFDWTHPSDVRFWLRARGDGSPVREVLRFFNRASARAEAPSRSGSVEEWKASWGPTPTMVDRALGYPFPDPSSPATLRCVLADDAHRIEIDHWGDATERDNVKFWAGAGGYPGASLAADALALVRGRCAEAASDPFALSAPQSSSFRLDWRRDYIPLDAGFSLNKHGDIQTVGFPLVELLAAVGLTHARPARPERRNKLVYEYAALGRSVGESSWFAPLLLRAGLGGAPLPFARRRFRMLLDWPGQEGQARSITTVTEEPVT